MSSRTRLPLLWHGPLLDTSGYADEGRTFLLALERAGYDVAARSVRWNDHDAGMPPAQHEAVTGALGRRPPDGDVTFVVHGPPTRTAHPTASPRVARTMYETDRIPAHWPALLIEADEVWVPGTFNVETFQRGGLPADRLHELPATLDFDHFAPEGVEPWPLGTDRSCVFLTNFDFTHRKGWDVLLDAWASAFGPDDDVCLVLKCMGLHVAPESIGARIQQHLGGRTTAPIVVNTDMLPATEMPRLYAAANAYVLASRGEGWGRPYMEAMAMGLPTIGSRWSGHLGFMHDGNSWLVHGTLVPIEAWPPLPPELWRGHRWFEPDADAVADAMREVAAGGAIVDAKAGGARADLIERFGPEPTAARIVELVEEALERWRWRRSRPVACVWRGEWGSAHSLAVVNDGHAAALSRTLRIERLVPASGASGEAAVGVAGHWPPSFEAPSAGPFVLYQPWEFGRIPARWVDEIRTKVDEVWTPSESARRAYVESGVAPELVHVVPNGVDVDRFTPEGPSLAIPTSRSTVFLFVGGTTHRKGIDLLLEGYARAFAAGDDVCLALKVMGRDTLYAGYPLDGLIARHRSRDCAPEIVLLEEDVPYDAMPALYRAADVVVQAYRGEGFCLPALEALACGVPVVVTEGGPTDEFVDEECGWLVPARRVPCPADALEPQYRLVDDGFLLEPDVDALADAVRDAADPEQRRARAAAARPRAERLAWEQVALVAADRIEALAGRTPVRSLPGVDVPGRRGTLLAAFPDWRKPETWSPVVRAYAAAFAPRDDVTLVLPAGDETAALDLVAAELGGADVADVAFARAGDSERAALELAADAVVCSNGRRPARARVVVPADPEALRAVLA